MKASSFNKSITAHDLTGGHVVFFTAAEIWSPSVDEAAIYIDEESLKAALTRAEHDETQQIIVGPYEIDVEIIDGKPSPAKLREKIRATGPTTAYGDEVTPKGFYAA